MQDTKYKSSPILLVRRLQMVEDPLQCPGQRCRALASRPMLLAPHRIAIARIVPDNRQSRNSPPVQAPKAKAFIRARNPLECWTDQCRVPSIRLHHLNDPPWKPSHKVRARLACDFFHSPRQGVDVEHCATRWVLVRPLELRAVLLPDPICPCARHEVVPHSVRDAELGRETKLVSDVPDALLLLLLQQESLFNPCSRSTSS